jgi:hypothetical protein
MRKLLVLLVVLAVSSVASAQIIDLQIASLNGAPITPVKEITIAPSDEVNIDIVSLGITPMLMNLDGIVSVASAGGQGTLLNDDMVTLTYPYDEGFNNFLLLEAGVAFEVATGAFMGMAEGIIIDHILVHCLEEGDVIVSVTPGDTWGGTFDVTGQPYGGAWGSVTIHQIPEPMTIALLGLGGLVLLRRRK